MKARQWKEVEIELAAQTHFENPYTDVQVWVDFTHVSGVTLRRPAFWDGDSCWNVRFASPLNRGEWCWSSFCDSTDAGLGGKSGVVEVQEGDAEEGNRFYRHGFVRMSPQNRTMVHADGRPLLLAADTAWGLPWRATPQQCREYALDRQSKGFNAALLMTVQPDRDACGPRERGEDGGFDVGFEDLPQGHCNELNVEYFRKLDVLTAILIDHEIVPVYQPVFHGFGWKGLRAAGPVIPDTEYARFCRYLVARYGARPALYLPSGDGDGFFSNVRAGGREFHAWDCYGHPTGNHYSPHATNRAWQEEEWLDFQWCQTGHSGEHLPERVMDMWRNTPAKGVANGEPSYEHMGEQGCASGWWQGEEALANIFSGGTMGTVYGAGSLWNWVLHKDEPGHPAWCRAPHAGWREALEFEGSRYPGIIARIFDGYPFADMVPNWDYTVGRRGLLVPGLFYALYLSTGGHISGIRREVPRHYRIYDPRTGELCTEGVLAHDGDTLGTDTGDPRLVLFSVPGTVPIVRDSVPV